MKTLTRFAMALFITGAAVSFAPNESRADCTKITDVQLAVIETVAWMVGAQEKVLDSGTLTVNGERMVYEVVQITNPNGTVQTAYLQEYPDHFNSIGTGMVCQ